MRRSLIFILTIIVFISSCTPELSYSEHLLEGPYTVTKVIDGDTLDVIINDKPERIRLSGINSAERGECYYSEAKEVLTILTLNKTVYIQQDITDKDRYNRLLRYVYLDDLLINEYLVEEGYVKVYDKYKDDTSKYLQLKMAEVEAVKESKGIWSCL